MLLCAMIVGARTMAWVCVELYTEVCCAMVASDSTPAWLSATVVERHDCWLEHACLSADSCVHMCAAR